MKADERSAMLPPKDFTDCIAFMLTHYDVWSATPTPGVQTRGAQTRGAQTRGARTGAARS